MLVNKIQFQLLALEELSATKSVKPPVGANAPTPAVDPSLPAVEEMKYVLSPAEDPFQDLEEVLEKMDISTAVGSIQ